MPGSNGESRKCPELPLSTANFNEMWSGVLWLSQSERDEKTTPLGGPQVSITVEAVDDEVGCSWLVDGAVVEAESAMAMLAWR